MNYSVKPSSFTININELKSMVSAGKSVPYTALQSSNESLQTICTKATEATLENGGVQKEEKASESIFKRISNYVQENHRVILGVAGAGLLVGFMGGAAYAASFPDPNISRTPTPTPTPTSGCENGQLFLVEHDLGNNTSPISIKSGGTSFIDCYPQENVEQCYYQADYGLKPDVTLLGEFSDKKTNEISFQNGKGAIKVSFKSGGNQISFENSCNIPSGFKECNVPASQTRLKHIKRLADANLIKP